MTGSRLIGIVVAVVAIGAIAYFAFPGVREKLDKFHEEHMGWTADARKKDPVGFMKYSIDKLNQNVGKFEDIRIDIRTGKAKLEKLKSENEAKIQFNGNSLKEFKVAFKTASETNKWPVDIAGRS